LLRTRAKPGDPELSILSVQSWVAYGHVGNAAALFPLQRLGAEVWAINTVQFSNHPGYGGFAGQVFEGAAIAALIDGLDARGVLGQVDAVLSGYLGEAATGEAVLDAVARIRALRPDALFCCDPVMGDRAGGLYVRPQVASLLQQRAPGVADILTPNQFELELLVPELLTPQRDRGTPPTLRQVSDAAQALRRRMRTAGPALVLVTSVDAHETPAASVDLLLASDAGNVLLRTPRLDLAVNGAGDLIAALFLLHVMRATDPVAALEQAVSSVWGVLERTARAGLREPMIVQAQEELVTPSRRFNAIPLG
jgi:pyridoxine kinase